MQSIILYSNIVNKRLASVFTSNMLKSTAISVLILLKFLYRMKHPRNFMLNAQIPENLKSWLDTLVATPTDMRGALCDDPIKLTKTLETAMKLNVVGISLPINVGGLNLNLQQQNYYYQLLSYISGTLAFFSTQFTTALSIISSGNNHRLKQQYLPIDNHITTSIGIATNHLKNFMNPMVQGQKIASNYIINGTLRYISGYNIFDMIVLGFTCNNEEIFALIPFKESESLRVHPQTNFIAANSTNTVNCTLNNYKITNDMIITQIPLGTTSTRISKSTRHLVSFHFGIAHATLDLIATNSYMKIDCVADVFNHLAKNLQELNNKMEELTEHDSIVALRVTAIALLQQIFLLGDQIFKGSGTIHNHPYAIIKREAQIIGATASSEETLIKTCELWHNLTN